MPSAFRSRVPAKITSCMWVPRSDFALCSPSTQLTPSRMFDLPHPFGPTTTAMPVPATVSSVRSQKLLKPRIWIFFSFSMSAPGVVQGPFAIPRQAKLCRITTDCTESKRQGQRTNKHFLWIRSPEFNFLQFTCFNPGLLRVSLVILAPFLHRLKVTEKVRGG